MSNINSLIDQLLARKTLIDCRLKALATESELLEEEKSAVDGLLSGYHKAETYYNVVSDEEEKFTTQTKLAPKTTEKQPKVRSNRSAEKSKLMEEALFHYYNTTKPNTWFNFMTIVNHVRSQLKAYPFNISNGSISYILNRHLEIGILSKGDRGEYYVNHN